MAEVHNKNASGEPSRLQPKSPWQDLGSSAASAGEEIMKFLAFPAPPAKSTQYIQPQPQATKDRRPGYIQDMDTDTMRQARVNALSDPSRAGETSAFRKQYLGENAAPYAPAPQSAPQEPEPSDDPFTAFVDKTKSEKEARRQMMQAQQPAGNALPPPHMWDGSWKNNTSQAKNPNNAIDPALASQLEAETATRENLRIPGNPKESAFTINPDAIALPPESQAADGTVTSAQTPDSSVMGSAEDVDPALEGPAGGPLMGQSQYGFDLAETPPSDQVPMGEDPIDEEVMTGILAGKTPTPETPAEEARIAYLQSQRGINANRELAGQDDIRAQIAQLRGYDQMDYRPLAALVDTWTGSKMAPSFAGPIDREPLIAQLNALIQKGDQHMTDADMQELKDYNDNQTRLEVAGLRGQGTGSDKATAATIANDRRVEAARLAVENRVKAAALSAAEAYKRAQLVAGDKAELKKVEVANALAEKDTNHATGLVNSPANKELGTSTGMADNLRRYRAAVKKYGLAPTGFQEGSERLAALYEEYTSLRKDLDKLGQLTASDLAIVRKQLPNATDAGYAASKFLQGKDGKQLLLDQIDATSGVLRRQGAARIGTIRTAYGSNKNYPITIQTVDGLESTMQRAFGDFIPPHKGGFKDLTPEQRAENKAAMDQYRKGE